MRHPIATAAALTITAIVTACGGKDNARPVEDVTVQAGRYEGVFPAAYGPGTDVMLDLMTDGSFVVVMSPYAADTITVRGTYGVSGTVLFAIDDEAGDTTYFKAGGDSLVQLDSNRSLFSTANANLNILRLARPQAD